MNWLETYSTPVLLIVLVAGLLALFLYLAGREKRQNALLRGRLYEMEKRTSQHIAALAESVNAVSQMSASASQNAEERIYQLSQRLDARMESLQRHSDQRLEQIRHTVDEQLSSTLERRLGQSFQQVSNQLEQVYKGLGEMQTLAGGVGDLKKVLQGVKTRGIWGEVRLGALLEQSLTAGQYLINTPVVPGSSERVEFAIRLPGAQENEILLPIDSKFPLDPFTRLVDASDAGDKTAAERAAAELARALLEQAKKISDKYIKPPHTTDFALLFLPVESLYAEILRLPGVAEQAQQKYRVLLTGPSTLNALLTSLQMGFRTLAVEQRTSEIYQLLDTLRADFGKFGDSLEKMRQRLNQATDELDSAAAKSRTITRRLNELDKYE